MSSGLLVAKIFSGFAVLTLAAAAGVGINKLTSSSEQDSLSKASSGVQEDGELIVLSDEYRWLGDGDADLWNSRLKRYGSGGSPVLDGYTGNEDLVLMKKACDDLKKGRFGKDVLSSKKKQAEEWCSTFKTIKQFFEGKRREVFLSFKKDDDNTNKDEWSSKFKSYSEQTNNEKLQGLSLSGKSEADGIKELKGKCKAFLSLQAEAEKLYLFKKWCTKISS